MVAAHSDTDRGLRQITGHSPALERDIAVRIDLPQAVLKISGPSGSETLVGAAAVAVGDQETGHRHFLYVMLTNKRRMRELTEERQRLLEALTKTKNRKCLLLNSRAG
jgi:hypothetical protein